MERFKRMGVDTHTHIPGVVGMQGKTGKIVKVRWVRVNIGSDTHPGVCCRLVAQEHGYGKRLGELFEGTPGLTIVTSLLPAVAGKDLGMELLGAKCPLVYGAIQSNIYIELPHQGPRHSDGFVMGKLLKATRNTRDAPDICGETVKEDTLDLGCKASEFHRAGYGPKARGPMVVVHVDDFLCVCVWGGQEGAQLAVEGIEADETISTGP